MLSKIYTLYIFKHKISVYKEYDIIMIKEKNNVVNFDIYCLK